MFKTIRLMIVAPWRLSILWFMLIALTGAVAPLLQIWATTELVNILTLQVTSQAIGIQSLPEILVPYLPSIISMVGSWILSTVILYNIFQPYLAAEHAERIIGYWSCRLLEKASVLRLEHFERPLYYDLLQRARVALNADIIAAQHTEFQRILARAASCLSILWVFSRVHWSLALLLAIGGLAVTRWRIQLSREMINVRRQHTSLQRRQDYWRGLVIQRAAAAEVRLFDLGQYIIDRWRTLSDQQLVELGAIRRRNFRHELPVTIAHTALYSLIGFGLILANINGSIGVGTLIALLFALQQYLDLIQNFTRLDRLHQVITELGYVLAFVSLSGNEATTGQPVRSLMSEGIRFENVSFTYPGGDQPVLHNINLHIRPGERIALVGENGAGKTTLIRLLLGLYQQTEGRITVEGVDLCLLTPTAWRQQVAAVFQEATRFALSVQENIGFGQIDQLDNKVAIAAAARKSGIAEAVEHLSRQYATVLGKEFDEGVDLSGGQWQKIAIARAYFRDAPIVILDEPAAALDAHTEWELYNQFLTLSTGKTVLLISHRLGSARLADRIIYLHNGQIVQMGTHDELMTSGGSYAELYELQASGYRKEDTNATAPEA